MEGRPLDEQALIARSQHGDANAFGELVRLHQSLALRVAFLVVRDHAEAADVTQEAFVKAYRSIGRFRLGQSFRPWLLRIVRNEALNRRRGALRRRSLRQQFEVEAASGEAAPSPEAVVLAAEDAAEVMALVEQLPERQRSVVAYRYLLGLSEADTAAALGIPVGTVKSRSARALERLRVSLFSGMPDE